jgi:hypothetical protein
LILKVVFTFYCFFLLMLSFFKSAEWFLSAIYQFEVWLGGDKLMHLKLSLILSVLASFAASSISKGFPLNVFWRLLFIQLFLVSCLLLDETHQYVMLSRRFEWMDFYYGASGLFIGLFIYCGMLFIRFSYKSVIKNTSRQHI